jgi:hypothetical protein
MPYQHIEQITERKGEKIALFLTAENAAGLMLAALPVYLISSSLPFWLRMIAMAGAALLGIVATLDVGGLALYERVVWRVRGLIRQRVMGRRVTPEQLAGAAIATRRERALRAGGPVQIVRQAGGAARRRAALAQPIATPSPSIRAGGTIEPIEGSGIVLAGPTPPEPRPLTHDPSWREGTADADRAPGQLPD